MRPPTTPRAAPIQKKPTFSSFKARTPKTPPKIKETAKTAQSTHGRLIPSLVNWKKRDAVMTVPRIEAIVNTAKLKNLRPKKVRDQANNTKDSSKDVLVASDEVNDLGEREYWATYYRFRINFLDSFLTVLILSLNNVSGILG